MQSFLLYFFYGFESQSIFFLLCKNVKTNNLKKTAQEH